eukprot:129032_1
MNYPFATIIAVLAMSIAHSASALLFSPVLLRVNNPWGTGSTAAAAQRNDSSSAPLSKIGPAKASSTIPPMASVDDFGHDEDLMRYKHELLGYVYDKSLNRGFDGGQGQ